MGALLAGPLGAVVLFWNNSLSVEELDTKISPNQGIWKSSINALKTFLIVTLASLPVIDFIIGIFGSFSIGNLREIFLFPFTKFWATLIMFGLPISLLGVEKQGYFILNKSLSMLRLKPARR